jgi:hypothetical protein
VDLEQEWTEAGTDQNRDKIAEFANLLIFGYLCGLRGEEIIMVDVLGFLKYPEIGSQHPEFPHLVVPLLGRLKGEMGERYHMMILARETASGIQPGKWADRLAGSLRRMERQNGFVFQNARGKQAKIGSYKDEFLD